MKVGFRCSEGGPVFDDALAEAKFAESVGFDSVWVAEHHGWDAFWPSSHMALAGLATRTDSIELGTSVTLLPEANPLRLAGEVALLDQISDGRFRLGVGVGWRSTEMENLGYDFERRGPRMTEHLEAMRICWTEEVASYDGEFVAFEEFELSPQPVQDPHPPVWVGGGVDAALKRAAHLAEAWFPVWIPSIPELQERMETYQAFVRETGEDPSERVRPLLRTAWIAEDSETAKANMKDMFATLIDTYRTEGGPVSADLKEALRQDFDAFADGRFVYGTPTECAANLGRYEDELDIDHVVLKLANPGVSHDQVMRFLELFGDNVLPAL